MLDINDCKWRSLTCISVGILLILATSALSAEPKDAADAIHPANVPQAVDVANQPQNAESEKETDVAKKSPSKVTKVIQRESDGFDIIAAPLVEAEGSSRLVSAKQALRSAQIRTKIGSAEHGNLKEFDLALQTLKPLETEIAKSGSASSDVMSATISALRSEIALTRETASTTFFGCFPLVRGYGLWPEHDEEFEIHSYARRGEALRHAVYSVLNQVAKTASADPLHLLVLVPGKTIEERISSQLAKVVDSQVHEAFTNVANITIYLGALRTEVDPMPAWNSPDSAFDPICRQFLKRIDPGEEPRSVMLVMVREFVDENHDGHWVQAKQRTYETATLEKAEGKPESLEADKVKVFESIAHDRSQFTSLLWVAFTVLFAVAIIVHQILSVISSSSAGDWQRWFAIPAAGFFIGFALTPFIMLAMRRWVCEPQDDAIVSAWWPMTAGALSLILPAGIFRLGAGTAGRYVPGLSCHGRWGIAFVPVALGTSAAWVAPTSYAIGSECILVVLMLAVAASFIVYCFGRAVDIADEFPIAMTPIAVGLSLAFGAGAFMGSPMVLAIVAGLAVVMTAINFLIMWRTALDSSRSDFDLAATELSTESPRSVEQLRIALKAPRYQSPNTFRHLISSIVTSAHRETSWIGLAGPATVGKTSAAHLLMAELQSQHPELRVLAGRCSQGSPPYQPFRDALAGLGNAAGVIANSPQSGEVNTIFERLADEFIPFWDFFSVDSETDEAKETSRHDLFEGVMNAIDKLTKRHGVILFLDDIQWIDEGSAALLKHLYENFVPGGPHALTIILATRETAMLEELNMKDFVFSFAPPSNAEQVHFLQNSLGIEQESAKHLVNALGVMNQEAGSIFWLIRAVGELITEDALVASPRGIKLRSSYLENKQLPVPEAMRAKLGASLRASGQYLPVLECAALLGEKFRVDDLAQCLGMDRLTLLQILRHLEQELQLVRDVVNDPECYAFSSEFMLEIVRDELGVAGVRSGIHRPISKIARELHGRIAAVLERRTPRTPQLICDLAHHYVFAGTVYASQCFDYCIAASETARKQGAFKAAREYLMMAEDSSRITRRSAELAEKRELIDRDESNAKLRVVSVPVELAMLKEVSSVVVGRVEYSNGIPEPSR